MENKQPKCRILMFPWLAYSHVFPFHELAKTLSNRNFHIYLCTSAVNLDLIRDTSDQKDPSFESIELVQLRIPSSPELPPNFHTTKNLPPHLVPSLLEAFQSSNSSFSEILSSVEPDLLIYDFFQPWAPKMAMAQGIPSVYFATSGATAFSFFHHLHTYGDFFSYPYQQEIYLLDHEKAVLAYHIRTKPNIKDADLEEFSFGILKLSCDIILMRSCGGVEGKYLSYLSSLCKRTVVPTGPLVQDSSLDYENDRYSDILKWLDKKEQFSTVFICFGSEHFLSEDQMYQIAKGLALCEANFIWVVRFPSENGKSAKDALWFEGFLEKVKERGMIVEGWAPQSRILSHPSVGGFVSHCGWSSVMESLYFGVPVISMPLKFDQPINGRLAVAVGVGVEVGRDSSNAHLCSGEEVVKAIDKVIVGKIGENLRCRARKLSEEIRRNEEMEMNEVAFQLLDLCIKNKKGPLPNISK